MTILVFGSTGMIGSEVTRYLKLQGEAVITPKRIEFCEIKESTCRPDLMKIDALIGREKPHFILNLAGKTRQRIANLEDEVDAILINSVFPGFLDEVGRKYEIPVLALATDCVFSGKVGNYSEHSQRDGNDVYALTKIAGEECSKATKHLRVSAVGLGTNNGASLAEWFCGLPKNSKIEGYANHYWNGVPAKFLGKVFHEIHKGQIDIPAKFHLATEGKLSKLEVLRIFRDVFNRKDIEVHETQTISKIDRSLTTDHQNLNDEIWNICGFTEVPTSEFLLRRYLP